MKIEEMPVRVSLTESPNRNYLEVEYSDGKVSKFILTLMEPKERKELHKLISDLLEEAAKDKGYHIEVEERDNIENGR